ncbi:response regulator transcription factor [Nonomuraea maritima]|uniref:response regulator transcription factor n=1 Tax=Nonomuraea maritima TaxID=683260 RepID=UPI00371FC950
MTVRVVVADDHPLFREGLRSLICDSAATELAGVAADGDEAVAVTLEQRPDVVVMDLRMPGLNGVEATRRIVAALPEVAVLVLTMVEDDASIFAAMRAGARGYVLKGAEPETILRSILVVAAGEVIFGSAVATRLTQFFAVGADAAVTPFPHLTGRERDILALMATGANNRAIALRLGLTEKTVRNNVSNIFAKLHVADRAAAVARARDAGLGSVPQDRPGR